MIMLGAAVYLLSEDTQTMCAGSKVEAAFETQLLEEQVFNEPEIEIELFLAAKNIDEPGKEKVSVREDDNSSSETKQEEAVKEPVEDKNIDQPDNDNKNKDPVAKSSPAAADAQRAVGDTAEDPAEEESTEIPANVSAENKAENNVETKTAEKASKTEAKEDQTVAAGNTATAIPDKAEEEEEKNEVQAMPKPAAELQKSPTVSYLWGSAGSYTFRIEIKITNSSADTSRSVSVSVPLLESSSPYQSTTLKSVNYDILSSSGRVKTFNIGDIATGETKTIIADFDISVRPVSINSTNETIDKARKIYEQCAGSGNCRTLVRKFISQAQAVGISAREVVGYARPRHGPMTTGCLQGCRHSWAEFYVDGLGWVPVDLTFQYFAEFPHASHIIEGYGDQSISVEHYGGSLTVSWGNYII